MYEYIIVFYFLFYCKIIIKKNLKIKSILNNFNINYVILILKKLSIKLVLLINIEKKTFNLKNAARK